MSITERADEIMRQQQYLLDEITEMALPLQAKLLRVLQEGEVDRLGGSAPVPVDVRVVATTNRDVLAAVRAGQFREDLYFRLNVIPLKLPPLRERKNDIPFLAKHFLEHFSNEYGKKGLQFAEGVLEKLTDMKWSGNVRELRNIIERGVLLARGNEIQLSDLLEELSCITKTGEKIADTTESPANDAITDGNIFNLSEIEKEMIKKALNKTGGNRTHAAKLLGISVRTLRNKLAEYRRMGLVL
jgi:two-component system response regulator FlrC